MCVWENAFFLHQTYLPPKEDAEGKKQRSDREGMLLERENTSATPGTRIRERSVGIISITYCIKICF